MLTELGLDIIINSIARQPDGCHVVTAYGAENFKQNVYGSISYYLFDDIHIYDDIIPESHKNNRPGDKIRILKYITVHDTANTRKGANAKAHDAYWLNPETESSVHYVGGNDGIYHLLPNDEWGYHAGDRTLETSEFYTIKTNVPYDRPYPTVSIRDGEYVINNQLTGVKAPLKADGSLPTTQDIDDLGIYTEEQNGFYAIGNTWYSKSYDRVCNHGGNRNSIGIEMCVDEGSDLYLTWAYNAKLVARLLKENNLPIEAVVQHHYFSGKDCPMAMRHAKLWPMFIKMVKAEYNMLTVLEDYDVKLYVADTHIKVDGRIIDLPDEAKIINYMVKVEAKPGHKTAVKQKEYIFTVTLCNRSIVDLGITID